MIWTTTAITQDVSVCANVLSHWLYWLLPKATGFDSYLLTVSLLLFENLAFLIRYCNGSARQGRHASQDFKAVLKWSVLFCCFTSQVNSYGRGGMVSSPNHTFPVQA